MTYTQETISAAVAAQRAFFLSGEQRCGKIWAGVKPKLSCATSAR